MWVCGWVVCIEQILKFAGDLSQPRLCPGQGQNLFSEQIKIDSIYGQSASHDLPEPDFVKIDVEGAELDVLIGMKETIEKYKPRLFIEVHGITMQQKIENAEISWDFSRKRIIQFAMLSPVKLLHFKCTSC